jgi:pimeloyl-ACP methyl ester carboxylesterase
LLVLHGLNGSSDAHYMCGIATKAFARGMNVVRLNQRNCGNTEHLSAGLFHSGLTSDVRSVLEELMSVDGLPAIGIAGYSLGGNLALKLAGDQRGRAPAALPASALCRRSSRSVKCARARTAQRLYQWNFRQGSEASDTPQRARPAGLFDLTKLDRIRTVQSSTKPTRRRHFGFAMPRTTPPGQRDAHLDRIPRPRAHHHGRRRSADPSEPFRRRGCEQPEYHPARVPPRRLTAVRRPVVGDDDGYWARARSSISWTDRDATSDYAFL